MMFHVSDEVIIYVSILKYLPASSKLLAQHPQHPPAISGDPAQIGLSGAKPCGCSTFKRLGKQ